jgi:hypothetical protein
MNDKIIVHGNDVVDTGTIAIEYNKNAPVSPLHLDFIRKDGHRCSISLTHGAVKELLKLIVNNF